MSIYDSEGVQVGNDDEKWDIYAQKATHDDGVIIYWAVDEEGTNVAKIQISSVYKWFSLLHHMENDRSDRAVQCLRKEQEKARLVVQSAVVLPEHRSLLSPSHCLALEQMKIILTESDRDEIHQDSSGSPGLACVHCLTTSGGFKYFPESMDALSLAGDMIVNHIQSCPVCPLQIRNKLNTMQKAVVYKEGRSLRSTKTDSDKIQYFQQLWTRLQSFESSSMMDNKSVNLSAVRKDSPSTKKRVFSEVDNNSTEQEDERPHSLESQKDGTCADQRKESTPSVKARAFELDNDLPEEEHSMNRKELTGSLVVPAISTVCMDPTDAATVAHEEYVAAIAATEKRRKHTERPRAAPQDSIPKPMQLNEFPFFFDGVVWVCRHCQHLPPYLRGRNYIWPRNESPFQQFVDTHLRFCPGLCKQLGMQHDPNAFPTHWLCHE